MSLRNIFVLLAGGLLVVSVFSSDVAHAQGSAGAMGFPSDLALSSNDHYLYLVDPFIMGGPSHIDVFKVGSNGSITHIQTTPSTLPNGISGVGAF